MASNDFDPLLDGKTHINVYSKGATELGRLLSNFAHTPFLLWGEGYFHSVESWWYWVKMSNINNSLLLPIFDENQLSEIKEQVGVFAKQYFRAINTLEDTYIFNPGRIQLKNVYIAKLKNHPRIKEMLFSNNLPMAHYYMMNYKKVNADRHLWTVELWEEIAYSKNV